MIKFAIEKRAMIVMNKRRITEEIELLNKKNNKTKQNQKNKHQNARRQIKLQIAGHIRSSIYHI